MYKRGILLFVTVLFFFSFFVSANPFISFIYPQENINVSQGNFFNVSVNVSCLSGTGNCGELNISLDPPIGAQYNFTTCGISGRNGPTQSNCNTNYSGTTLDGLVLVDSSGRQNWSVPSTGTYLIEAWGAGGADGGSTGGKAGYGAYISGEFELTAGIVLEMIVGQKGSRDGTYGGGGGGGSFIIDKTNNITLIIAGGGGGGGIRSSTYTNGRNASINITGVYGSIDTILDNNAPGINGNGGSATTNGGGGGAGYFGNGADSSSTVIGGKSYVNGGAGGAGSTGGSYGGFGGGGNGYGGGGAGGGYNGGGGGGYNGNGGGGGGGSSYNNGSNQNSTYGANLDLGMISITLIGSGKNGLISTNEGDTPFYTNVTNPYNLTLNEGESQIITWWVNATGTLSSYPFFAFVNKTSNMNLSNSTLEYNISIIDDTFPENTIIYPSNSSYSTISLDLNYSLVELNKDSCWYSNNSGLWNSTSVLAGSNFTNINYSVGANTFSVYCNDTSGNTNVSEVSFSYNPPQILLDVTYPNVETYYVNKSAWFKVSVNVSCIGSNCGELNVSLDPKEEVDVGLDLKKEEIDLVNNSNYSISSAIILYDNKSFDYDIQDGCSISDGESDVFDGGIVLKVNGSTYSGTRSGLEDNNREALCNGQIMSLLNVSRKVYVPSEYHWARYLEIFQNLQSYTVCANIQIYSNMGSDGADFMNTSNGNLSWGSEDNWIIWDDTNPTAADDTAGFIYQTDSTDYKITDWSPKTASGGTQYFQWSNFCIPAGERRILMHFFTQMDTRDQAINQSNYIYENNAEEMFRYGLSSEESSEIVNFIPGAGPKGGLISTNEGDTPFYTNVTNPYNLTLNEGESQIITWWVNATGTMNANYTFFIYANLTSNMALSNVTNNWTITITNGTVPKQINSLPINIVYPVNGSFYSSVSGLNYTYSNSSPVSCKYSSNNGKTNYSIECGQNVSISIPIVSLNSVENMNNWTIYINDSEDNFNFSRVSFFIDTLDPVVDFNSQTKTNNSYFSAGNIFVNLSITESYIDTISYFLHNSTDLVNISMFKGSISAVNWTGLQNGVYYYNVSVNDSNNNFGYTSTRLINLDIDKPNVFNLEPFNGSNFISENLSFSMNFSDNFGLANFSLFVWNGSNSLINRSYYTLSGIENYSNISFRLPYPGNFKWNVQVYDLAGNNQFNRSNYSLIYELDSTSPQVSFVSPTTESGSYRDNKIYARVSFSDAHLSNVTLRLYNSSDLIQSNFSNLSGISGSYSINYFGLADGYYYLNASVSDVNGNINHTQTHQIILDNSPPSVFLINPVNLSNYSSKSLNASFVVNDSLSTQFSCGVYLDNIINYELLSVNLTVLENYETIFNLDNLKNRTYSWFVSCNDSAGNSANSTLYYFLQDSVSPIINIYQPYSDLAIGNLVYISSEISDNLLEINHAFFDIINQSNYSQFFFSGNLNSSSGWDSIWNSSQFENSVVNLTLEIFANDSLGNNISKSVNFSVDNVNPSIQIISPNLPFYSSNFSLNIVNQDTNLEYVLFNISSLNGDIKQENSSNVALYNSYSWQDLVDVSLLDSGFFKIDAFANDSAGNSRLVESNFSVDIDPPSISIESPIQNYRTNESYVLFSWRAIDSLSSLVYCNLSLNGLIYDSDIVLNNGSIKQYIVSGFIYSQKNWSVVCKDLSGNINRSSFMNFTTNFIDSDNDGIHDSEDNVIGNNADVRFNGFDDIDIYINGSNNLSNFDDIRRLEVYTGSNKVLELLHNFTRSSFDLSKVNITAGSGFLIINLSQQLQSDQNKSIYFVDAGYDTLCIKDYEISSISEMSSDCSGLNEVNATSCLNNSLGEFYGDVYCIDNGDSIQIDNLRYSAVLGGFFDAGSSSSNSSVVLEQHSDNYRLGAGGYCVNSWVCSSWSYCSVDNTQVRSCNLAFENGCMPNSPKPNEFRVCKDLLFDVFVNIVDSEIYSYNKLKFKVDLFEINDSENVDVEIFYEIVSEEGMAVYQEMETRAVNGNLSYLRSINIGDLSKGKYKLKVYIKYGNNQYAASLQSFKINSWDYNILIYAILIIIIIVLARFAYLRHAFRKEEIAIKKYLSKLEKELPQI